MLGLISETPFRVTLVVVIVLAVVTVRYHRRRAASAGGPVSRQAEGWLLMVLLRLAAAGLWFATLAYLINPAWVAWAAWPLPASVRWLGAVAALFGCGLIGWTLASLGTNLTDTVAARSTATLVTDGPYRWVRHPYYTAAAMLIGAVALLTANGLIALCGVVLVGLLALRTPREEAALIDRFGEAYREYAVRTGRFVPLIGRARLR